MKRKVIPGSYFKIGMKMKSVIPFRKKIAEKYKNHINKIKEEKQKPEKENLEKLNISEYRKRLMELSIMPKSNIFEDRIHVPLIFYGYNLDTKKIINDLVRSVDIFPTIFDICKLKNKLKNRRGESLTPLMFNSTFHELSVFLESSVNVVKSPDSNVIGIRTSEFKYFRDRNITSKNIKLFNLLEDPLEENNIAESNTQKINEFENKLKMINPRLNFAIKYNDENEIGVDEAKEIEEKLRQAGYIN